MSLRCRQTRTATIAAAAGLMLGLSFPAASQELYHWRAEDGSYAFTDDPRRVPERYRAEVEVRPVEGLDDYGRYTPEDDARISDYARELDERVERLRALNARSARPAAVRPAGRRAARGIDVRVAEDEQPVIHVETGGDSAPVVIEKVRVLPEGANRTRTDTVIRQGDRVLAIVKPTTAQGSLQYPDEADLEK